MEWAALIRISIALLFLGAATAKLARFAPFVEALRGYALVPRRGVRLTAAMVVTAEMVVGFALALGWRQQATLRAAACLLALFGFAVAFNLIRERATECGCLGDIARLRLGWASVVLNFLIALSAAIGSYEQPIGIPFPTSDLANGETLIVIWTLAPLLVLLYWEALYAFTIARLIDAPLTTEDTT